MASLVIDQKQEDDGSYSHGRLRKAATLLRTLPGAIRWEAYEPFGRAAPRAVIGEAPDGKRSVLSIEGRGPELCWLLPPSGVKPGHGLLMAPYIRPGLGTRVLDLGCGPLAFHAVLAAQRGAARVVAVDVEESAVASSRRSASAYPSVQVIHSDLTAALGRERFDYVVFHPPMLPETETSTSNTERSYHVGGATGREVLDRGLEQAAAYLNPGGVLVIGQFEFLGVERAFGPYPTTLERLELLGLRIEAVHHHRVRMTAPLRGVLPRLRRLFPDYRFERAGSETLHRFTVLLASSVAFDGDIPVGYRFSEAHRKRRASSARTVRASTP